MQAAAEARRRLRPETEEGKCRLATPDSASALDAQRTTGDRRATAPRTRERIIDAAAELFYAEGLRAVSADRIIAAAGITKGTFYNHFKTKDDIIVAYLARRSGWEREAIARAQEAADGDVDETIRLISEGIGGESCSPGFRGCAFINAAAEYADPGHPVRVAVDAHRRWFTSMLEDLMTDVGIDDPSAAEQLLMLRDGAMVTGYLGRAETVGAALLGASRAVIAAHRPSS